MKNSIKKEIIIPGSKSYTNRALFLAAMTKGSVKIKNPLISDDTKAMINCLKTLGIKILRKKDYIEVTGDISLVKDDSYELDADLSGTTIRFVLALCCIIPGIKIVGGKERLNNRPIEDLVNGLKQLGAKITYLEKESYPPLRIESSKLSKSDIKINGSVSSQYLSAILMIAPLIGGATITVIGEQISKPYIDMTIDIMKKFGVSVINQNYKKHVVSENQKYTASEYVVEGDVSSASYFFALAALKKSTLTLKNLNPHSVQADMKFLKILEQMGNKISFGKNEITISGKGAKTVNVDMADCPDQAQTLAVLCAFAKGASKITGIKSLRIKETERIIALQNELKKMGIKTVATNDSFTIYGGDPKPAAIDTYGDHRMAMAFAVAKAKLPGITINNPEVVNKTFPDFWKKLEELNL